MQEQIKSLITRIQEAQAQLKTLAPEFKAYIRNKDIPLEERWSSWVTAPSELKGGYGWISAGRLKAFHILGVDDVTEYEGMFWWERHQEFSYEEYLDYSLEILAESSEGDYEGVLVWDKDLDQDDMDKWIARNPIVQEFIRQFKEEVLASGLSGFKYDW